MMQACRSIKAGNLSDPLKRVIPGGFSVEIVKVAAVFQSLQDARHIADYDTEFKHSREYVLPLVEKATEAFSAWKTARKRPEAAAFLAALLLERKWKA